MRRRGGCRRKQGRWEGSERALPDCVRWGSLFTDDADADADPDADPDADADADADGKFCFVLFSTFVFFVLFPFDL